MTTPPTSAPDRRDKHTVNGYRVPDAILVVLHTIDGIVTDAVEPVFTFSCRWRRGRRGRLLRVGSQSRRAQLRTRPAQGTVYGAIFGGGSLLLDQEVVP